MMKSIHALIALAISSGCTVHAMNLPAGTAVSLVENCLSPATQQILPLLIDALRARGIEVSDRASLRLVVELRPCDEFNFANQGPRDLDDAPLGPMGSRIEPPILRKGSTVTQSFLRLTLVDPAKPKPIAVVSEKIAVPKGRAGWTLIPSLVRPTLDALLLAANK
jgi:hypothetical protein